MATRTIPRSQSPQSQRFIARARIPSSSKSASSPRVKERPRLPAVHPYGAGHHPDRADARQPVKLRRSAARTYSNRKARDADQSAPLSAPRPCAAPRHARQAELGQRRLPHLPQLYLAAADRITIWYSPTSNWASMVTPAARRLHWQAGSFRGNIGPGESVVAARRGLCDGDRLSDRAGQGPAISARQDPAGAPKMWSHDDIVRARAPAAAWARSFYATCPGPPQRQSGARGWLANPVQVSMLAGMPHPSFDAPGLQATAHLSQAQPVLSWLPRRPARRTLRSFAIIM